MVTMRTLPTEELPLLGFLDLGVTLSHSNHLELKDAKDAHFRYRHRDYFGLSIPLML